MSIEENELVGNAFDEYGVRLREEGDFGSLGIRYKILLFLIYFYFYY